MSEEELKKLYQFKSPLEALESIVMTSKIGKNEKKEVLHQLDILKLQKAKLNEYAHNMRSPLTSVIGFLELAKEYFENGNYENIGEFLDIALKQSEYISSIGQIALLSAEEEQSAYAKPYKIGKIMEIVEAENKLKAKKNYSINFSAEYDSVKDINIYRHLQVRQCIDNLIGNAFKFTPKEGSVKVNVELNKPEATIEYTVQDTGRGVPKDKVESIWEQYEQANKEQDQKIGFGMGLHSVKRMIENMNGSVHVESQEGKGSKFILNVYLEENINKHINFSELQ